MISLDNKKERAINLSIRNVIREKTKSGKSSRLVEGDIYFERVKKGEARAKRK